MPKIVTRSDVPRLRIVDDSSFIIAAAEPVIRQHAVAGAIVFGRIADRKGRKFVLITTMLMNVMMLIAFCDRLASR